MHIFFTVCMCKCTHIFCICICWHTDICLKHIYTCNIYVYSCLLACFWSCLSFMILYVHFFYFSFLRKKSSFFCYLFVGWQHWALIKKNYSWSCSCYPLCEIINDFIDRRWWHILFMSLVKNLYIYIFIKTVKCREKADKLLNEKIYLRLRACVCTRSCMCVRLYVKVCRNMTSIFLHCWCWMSDSLSEWVHTTPHCVSLL